MPPPESQFNIPPPPPGPIIEVGPGGPPLQRGGGGGFPPHEGKMPGGLNPAQNFVPTYHGWILRKAPAEPGQRPDWTRANITEFPVSNRAMAQRAKAAGNRKTVTEVYDSLKSNTQREHVDRLIEERKRLETNVWAEWELANIEVMTKRQPGLFGPDRIIETTQIRVILKRLPRAAAKMPEQKVPAKNNNLAGVTVDLLDLPPAGNNVPKFPGNPGGMERMGPGGPGAPPPPHFPPPEAIRDGRVKEPLQRRNSQKFRSPSPGPRTSGAAIDRVIHFLDRLALKEGELDYEYIDDEDDMDRPGRRRSKYLVHPPPIRRPSRRLSRPRRRRASSSSFEMQDELDTSSSNSSNFTEATPPSSAGIDRSRSRGRYLDHRKRPSVAVQPKVSYNFYGDVAKDPAQIRRRSDGEPPYAGAYRRPVLPLAPEAPLYNGAYSPFIEAPVRRATLADDQLRREMDAFERGREQEQRRHLTERFAELKKQQKEERMRRIDELRREEDMRRMEDGLPDRRYSRSYSPTDMTSPFDRR